MTVLIPILAEVPYADLEGHFMQVLGGLAQMPSAPDPVFYMAYRTITRHANGHEEVLAYGSANSDILEYAPEFEDLYALRGCWISGAPQDAHKHLFMLLGYTGDVAYKASNVMTFARITEVEADALFLDTLGAALEHHRDESATHEASDFLSRWIVSQGAVWEAQAQSCIDAHELPFFDFNEV